MNIIIINNNKSEFFNETKNLALKFNENNEYHLYDISDINHFVNDFNIPLYEMVSNVLFSENNVILNIESIEMLDNNVYLKYVIKSSNTTVLNFNSDKFTTDDILIKTTDFVKDIKEKISKHQANLEKNNELIVASKILNGNGLFLFGNKLNNKSRLCLIPGPPNQPIYFSEFTKALMTFNDVKFYKSVSENNVVFVREYSPVHEVISKMFEKKVGN